MALKGGERPVLDALRPVEGSLRLAALRLLLVVLSSLPALLVALSGLASEQAREPYFTEVGGRLPFVPLMRLMGSLFPALGAATLVCVVLGVLGDQILTAGALSVLSPARSSGGRVKVFRTVLREGLAHLAPFLRLVILSLILSGVGIAAIRSPFKMLDRLGERAGWTGATRMLTLPLLSAGLMVLWLASAGAWFFWCRVLTVADGRRRVRRTALLALRVFWRHPLRSWAFFVTATVGSTLASGTVVFIWLQSEPKGAAVVPWVLVWLVTLAAQACIWLWLLRAGCLLYASDTLADLRRQSDEPFGFLSWMTRWRRKQPAEPPLIPQQANASSVPGQSSPGRTPPCGPPPIPERESEDHLSREAAPSSPDPSVTRRADETPEAKDPIAPRGSED